VAIENARRYEAVLQERNLIQTMVASMADGLVVTDAEGRVVMCNQAAQEMVGVQTGEKWFDDGTSGESAAWISPPSEVDRAALVDGQWQTTLQREGRVLSVNATALPPGGGENRGVVYVIRDISRWAELDQIKSDFISQVSHELRTPLTTVKTLVGLMRKASRSGQEIQEYLDVIESEVNRQAQLVNDLLEMGRLEAGEVSWTVVEVSLGEVVEKAMRACLPLAAEKEVGLIGHPLPALPRVMGSPRRLQQVFVNLLDNAVKYTPPGGRVTVEAGSDEGAVWVAVQDTGVGIPKGDLPYVFDKFYQGRPGGRSAKGVGLGLAIARHIVEAFDGTLQVESEVGRGSCFTVRLPRARRMVAEMRKNLKGADDERQYSVDRR
jgi:PAS domain S-box-containing protein